MKFCVRRVSGDPVTGEGVYEDGVAILALGSSLNFYVKEINTLEELMAFSKEQGAACIIGEHKYHEEFGMPEILIYDDDME